jgi:hypothetical protein
MVGSYNIQPGENAMSTVWRFLTKFASVIVCTRGNCDVRIPWYFSPLLTCVKSSSPILHHEWTGFFLFFGFFHDFSTTLETLRGFIA